MASMAQSNLESVVAGASCARKVLQAETLSLLADPREAENVQLAENSLEERSGCYWLWLYWRQCRRVDWPGLRHTQLA
jgi:hypothetical protein